VKIKRTYNLNESTVRRVRELAGEYRVAETQDGVVEKAVERLFQEERARQDAEDWTTAAGDPEFAAEMTALARDFEDRDSWPA
jgi:hypothetical protein